MNIGNEIKTRRTELNLTQEELAKQLNVSRTAISNWEQQRNYPDIELLVTISDCLDISLDTLLRGDTKMVKELSLDYKKKKRLKIAITIFSFLTIALIALCIAIWSHQPGVLSPKDLVVEKVDIIKVPAQTVDGLAIKEDNSYLVHIKSKSLFTRLEYEGYDRTGNMY